MKIIQNQPHLTIGLASAAIFLIIFSIIAANVILKTPLIQLDQSILQSVSNLRTPGFTFFFSIITTLANWESVVFIALLSIIKLIRNRQFFYAKLFACNLALGQGIGVLLKSIIARPRPDLVLHLVVEDNFSFPSGHALAATLLFGFLAYLIVKNLQKPLAKIAIIFYCLVMIFLISLSRVYLGVHFPSDIVGGVILGSFILSISITFAELHQKPKHSQPI